MNRSLWRNQQTRVIALGGFAVFMQLDRIRRSNFKHIGSIRTDIKRIPAHKSERTEHEVESETASRMSSSETLAQRWN